MDFHLLKHIRENDDVTVVWLFNIGLEKYWNGEVFTVKNFKEDIMVNHVEEMNLFLTRKQDILILRAQPNQGFIDEMRAFGAEIPTIVCPQVEDEAKSISQLVLEDEGLVREIKALVSGKENVMFVPYGVSTLEEQIADKLELPMFGSSNEINRMVNNKVFSRKFALEHGFRVSEGRVCHGFDELETASKDALERFGKIIIKEPCGASGKGLWVVETSAKLKSTLLIIKRFFKDNMDGEWLVEEWCEKAADLNYQIYVGIHGEVEVFSIKEQKVNGTVYVGSVMPPAFTDAIMKECKEKGDIIGRELYKMGYRGILGVDAMILTSGELIPIIEINGRCTLSTYVSFAQEKKQALDKKIFAFYKKISLGEGEGYLEIKHKLTQAGLWYQDNHGLFVYTSEAITQERVGESGRMFGLIFAENEEDMMQQYERVTEVLCLQ